MCGGGRGGGGGGFLVGSFPHTAPPSISSYTPPHSPSDPTSSDTPPVCAAVQGLDDHAHKPTLQRLPKHLQIVGSPAAATVAESLGFTNVIGLDHGKTVQICEGRLNITATAGKRYDTSQFISMVAHVKPTW